MITASFFQEFWKRKQHELEYDWDCADFESEEVSDQLKQHVLTVKSHLK